MRSLLASAALLAALLASGCNTRADITCFSCPNWRMVNSDGCAEIATRLNCEFHEVKARDDGACAEGLVCVLTGCDDDEGGGEVCSTFAQM